MASSDTFPPCSVTHSKRHRELMEESLIKWIVKHTVYRVFLRWKCGCSHREARTSNCAHRQSQLRYGQGQSSAAATNHQNPSSNICHPKPS